MESELSLGDSLCAPAWLSFLCAVCAVAEGAAVTVTQTPQWKGAESEKDAAAACVSAVLHDAMRRIATLGGRAGMPRSLGSVYAGAASRLLGGFRGVASRVMITAFHASGVAVSRDGATLLVSDSGSHAIHVFRAADGMPLRVVGICGTGGIRPLEFSSPRQLWVASDDHVFVADHGNNRVQILTPRLEFHAFVGERHQLYRPVGVCADDDVIAVSDYSGICIFRRSDRQLLHVFGYENMSRGGELCFLPGHQHIAVADRNEFAGVKVFCLNGDLVRRLKIPGAISVGCSDANELVVASHVGHRVYVVNASGDIVWASDKAAFVGVALHGSTIFAQTWDDTSAIGKCFVYT